MHRILSISCFLFFFTIYMAAQPKHEVRAAWITAVYGLDWPRTQATTPEKTEQQKQELIGILDKLKAANFNTILFQTRTRGDVLYRSAIEPFNSILTGTTGKDPGYDPLAFAVEECHKRGMECHAWMVAMPLGSRKHVASLGSSSVTRKQRDICVPYKNEYFLNPGHPATKEYLMSLVREVVGRYDVDGVHFDYLRYPEYAGSRFKDTREYTKYGKGKTIDQWRRDNLTSIVRYIYREVKRMKPWVKVSTCPVGKYKDTSRYSSRGWNAFYAVCQDPQAWLKEGIQDQIYPMMYFQRNSFYPFALDWQEQSYGRHVVPGIGIYFLDPKEGNWNREEIERQLHFIRRKQLAGAAHYRVKYLMDNTKGLFDELVQNFYAYPALQPPMTWMDSIPPAPPSRLSAKQLQPGYTRLEWSASADNDTLNAPQYVIYASDTYPVDTSDPKNIVTQGIRDTHYIYAPLVPWKPSLYFAVTAVDRYGNESRATQCMAQ